MERPELKEFRRDPLKIVKAERGKYVVAALTIVRAYIQRKGGWKPPTPIKNYDQWCTMVRDPIIWLGRADPCETMERIRKTDRALETRKAIAQHWHDNFRDKGVTAREVIDEAERRFEGGFNNGKLMHQDFYAALAEVALDGKTLSSNKLGGWLRAISGKIVGNPGSTAAVETEGYSADLANFRSAEPLRAHARP
jgi:putative DNA primase/helicase